MSPQETEQHRHRCEVRDLIKKRVVNGKTWLLGIFDQIERARGRKSLEKLKADFLDQWNKGNRGDDGLWL